MPGERPLSKPCPETYPKTVSKHIGALREAGLVEGRRDGRWVYCTANEAGRDAVRGFLDELQSSIHRPHLADDCCEKRDSA